eukprot:1144903-Pelagomonas_calceolata.AAC.6
MDLGAHPHEGHFHSPIRAALVCLDGTDAGECFLRWDAAIKSLVRLGSTKTLIRHTQRLAAHSHECTDASRQLNMRAKNEGSNHVTFVWARACACTASVCRQLL